MSLAEEDCRKGCWGMVAPLWGQSRWQCMSLRWRLWSTCVGLSRVHVFLTYNTIRFSILAQPCQWVVVVVAGPAEIKDGKRSWDSKYQKMPKGTATVKNTRPLRRRASEGLRKDVYMSFETWSYTSWGA